MKENNNKISKSYIIYTIIAGLLTLIPISTLLLEAIKSINPNIEINEYIYKISFYLTKIIGFLIYFLILKNITKKKITLTIISGIFLFLSITMLHSMSTMENTGIDGIGEALILVMGFNLCIYIYYFFTFILFISYSKKFIFKKKVIISIISIIVLIFTYNIIIHNTTTAKITKNIPSVNDFKNELIKRNLYNNNNIIYGIDNNNNNSHKLSFIINKDEKYPSYIYYGYYSEDILWTLFYINGKIYAALSKYYEPSYSNNYNKYSTILTEENKIYTYNISKNFYDISKIQKNCINTKELTYYNNNFPINTLEKNTNKYNNNSCEKYEIINKIDSSTLDNYAKNIKNKY